MEERILPLKMGEAAPEFTLAAANRDGMFSLSDLRGQAFLIGFYRGLHCPFCRRQVVQLGAVQPALRAAGMETLAVINTPVERARMYFRHRPTPVMLLSDPDCLTHRAYGVPRIFFLPEGSSVQTEWPHSSTTDQFGAARINPTGEMPEPTQPMAANVVLNARDNFQMEQTDDAILAAHGTQLVGHFLVDSTGFVRWMQIEAPDGPDSLCTFPTAAQLIAAAGSLAL